MTEVEKRQDRSPVPKDWTYAPAPESTEIVKLQDRYELFIGGQWRAPKSGKYFTTVSPSTEMAIAEVADANARDIGNEVSAAHGSCSNSNLRAASTRRKCDSTSARVAA